MESCNEAWQEKVRAANDTPVMHKQSLDQTRKHRPQRVGVYLAITTVIVIVGVLLGYLQRLQIHEWWLMTRPIETLQTLDAQSDADTLTHYALATRLIDLGKLEEASPAAANAVKSLSESDRSALARKVLATNAYLNSRYASTFDTESAIAQTERLGGDEPMTHLAKGMLADRRKEFSSAISEFTRTTELEPHLAEAWSRLAAVESEAVDPTRAASALRKAVEIAPQNARFHADLAQALGQIKRYDEAANECNIAARLAPDNPSFGVLPAVSRASAARTDSDYNQAVHMLTSAIQKYPDVDFLHELVAGLHMRFGKYAEARAELEPFLVRHPSNTGAWLNLSVACDKLGDENAAGKAFAEYHRLMLLQAAPVPLAQRAMVHQDDPDLFVKLSQAYQAAGRMKEAYVAIGRARELRPASPDIAHLMAQVQTEMTRRADTPSPSGAGLSAQ